MIPCLHMRDLKLCLIPSIYQSALKSLIGLGFPLGFNNMIPEGFLLDFNNMIHKFVSLIDGIVQIIIYFIPLWIEMKQAIENLLIECFWHIKNHYCQIKDTLIIILYIMWQDLLLIIIRCCVNIGIIDFILFFFYVVLNFDILLQPLYFYRII